MAHIKEDDIIPVPIGIFKEHFDENERIIFSGKYGLGKTFYLDEFFKDESISKGYYPIHLFPVNYSVASNEDIFKLIKYDILYSLLSEKEISFEFEKIEIPILMALSEMILVKEEREKLFSSLIEGTIKSASKLSDAALVLDPSSRRIVKGITSIFEKSFPKVLEQAKNRVQNEEIDELRDLHKFIDSVHNGESGFIYEDDVITQIVTKLINQVQDKGKDIVLIIDDLDRIEPEHIFRLFNIFSAHFDIKGQGNKYDFNKVIFVCDIDNIEGIYKHKYGEKTDFDGYIDKFYSSTIFHFDNIDNVFQIVNEIVNNIVFNGHRFKDNRDYDHVKKELKLFFKEAVFNKAVNLRQLLKKVQYEEDDNSYTIDNITFNKQSARTLITIDILKEFFGSINALKNAVATILMNSKVNKFNNGHVDRLRLVSKRYLTTLIGFLAIEEHRFTSGTHRYQLNRYLVNYEYTEPFMGVFKITTVTLRSTHTFDQLKKEGEHEFYFLEDKELHNEVQEINYLEFLLEGIKKAEKFGLCK